MAQDKSYTIYHMHSDISNGVTNIDSITKYNQYIDLIAENNMESFGFAEHVSWLGNRSEERRVGKEC